MTTPDAPETSGAVSVIIPARNAAGTIERTLQALGGSKEVLEIIVIDDGSTDGTADVVHAVKDPRICVLPGPGRGIAAALNTGFSAAQGAYIARCDADDTYTEGHIDRQAAWLGAHPDYIAVSCEYATLRSGRDVRVETAFKEGPGDVTEHLQKGKAVTHFCTWLTRRTAIDAIGGAREWFETAEDLDLQFRLAGQGRVYHLSDVGYVYVLDDSSITQTQKQVRRAFYEAQAIAFAHQRRQQGQDALEQGQAPSLPEITDSDTSQKADHRMARLLVSAAWRSTRAGDWQDARHKMEAARQLHPFSPAVLWNWATFQVKSLRRHTRGAR